MKKSYSSFTNSDIKSLGIKTVNRLSPFITKITPQTPSVLLLEILKSCTGLPLQSEQAKSAFLIAPIINEIRLKNPKKFTFFSGCDFDIDKKKGLKGNCDFLISTKYNAVFVERPLLTVVQIKNDQDLLDAVPRCIAEMYAIQLFNERENTLSPVVFGAITNGYSWLFLKLETIHASIYTERYHINNLPELLGIWQTIVDSF